MISYRYTVLCSAVGKQVNNSIFTLEFIRSLPDLTQADGDMEPVEDGKRHGDMGNYGPSFYSIKVHLRWVGCCTRSFKGVEGPHSKITHQHERYLEWISIMPVTRNLSLVKCYLFMLHGFILKLY